MGWWIPIVELFAEIYCFYSALTEGLKGVRKGRGVLGRLEVWGWPFRLERLALQNLLS
jgi:hypothetical protein